MELSANTFFQIEGMFDLEDVFVLRLEWRQGMPRPDTWPSSDLERVVNAWWVLGSVGTWGGRIADARIVPDTGGPPTTIRFDAAGANVLQVLDAVQSLVRAIHGVLAKAGADKWILFTLAPG